MATPIPQSFSFSKSTEGARQVTFFNRLSGGADAVGEDPHFENHYAESWILEFVKKYLTEGSSLIYILLDKKVHLLSKCVCICVLIQAPDSRDRQKLCIIDEV